MEREAREARLIYALAVARAGRLAVALGGPECWRVSHGYTFIPAELPQVEALREVDLAALVSALALRFFGCGAEARSSRAVYGPSERHAIDRLRVAVGVEPAPLLRLERAEAADEEAGGASARADGEAHAGALRRTLVRVYRARLVGEPVAGAATAGTLWLAPGALRLALRGAPLSELVGRAGALLQEARPGALPDDAFIYAPGHAGERSLLRIAAKYGEAALLQDADEMGPLGGRLGKGEDDER